MKRIYVMLCAVSIAFSCQAQFFSIGGATERPRTVVVNNHQTEPSDSIHETEKTSEAADTLSDYRQQMVDMWTSVSMPLDKMKVTSQYGMRRHPIYHKNMPHNGIDLSVPTGTKVYAIMDGVVKRTGYDGRSGNFIVIDHGDYQVSYCHLSKVLVRKGEHVRAGQTTCLSGNTGASTGSHLHYGLKDKNGKWCNPRILLDKVDETRRMVLTMIQQHDGGLDG